jgi:glycosyltransferase involved in cell wall biosynthesis
MKPSIAISIIIPCFNEEQLISNCLTSITKQDFELPYEIIVVDNNSTDKTAEIARSFNVKVIKEAHQGVIWARQKGLTQAKGEIIAQADSDCIYPKNWLSLIYKHFSNSKVVAVGGPATGEKHPFWAYLVYKLGFGFVNFIYKLTGVVIYLGGFNFAFRKKTLQDLGGYQTFLDSGGDEWDILWRLKTKGKVIFEPKAIINLSSRRYRVGFIKFWVVHAGYYYCLNFISAKILKKQIIHSQSVRNI